jgi:integrase
MAVKKFSDTWIRNLKPTAARKDYHEGGGFYLRVQPTGKKAFYYIYRLNSRLKIVKIGDYPAMLLRDAHKRHQEMIEMRENGLDPSVEIRAEKRSTFADLSADYLKRHAVKNGARHRDENTRILDQDVLPFWGERPAGKIKRADVVALLNKILDREAPRQANKTLACIRKIFNHGLNSAWPGLEYNPCANMPRPGTERKVDRWLTAVEIKAFWEHVTGGKIHPALAACLKFILVTGVRPSEALFAEWHEFDKERRWWTIPPERMKNGRPHRVYINDMAQQLLNKELPMPFPFPVLVTGLSRTLRRQFDLKNNPLPKPTFTPKDLRRTYATHLGGLGYQNAQIGKVLSHTDTSVTAVYNLYEYDELKKEMAVAWGHALQGFIDAKPSEDEEQGQDRAEN